MLVGDIAAALHGVPLPSGFSASAGASPAVLQHLPAAIRDGYIAGFAQVLHTVFLYATLLAALGFVLSLFLKEVPLRNTVRAVDRAHSTVHASSGGGGPGCHALDGARTAPFAGFGVRAGR